MNTDEIVAAVEQDVVGGLGELLDPASGGFNIIGPFADRRALVDGDYAVVQWRFDGIDCRNGFNGMWPTGKRLVVTGLTVVDLAEDPLVFHRHVDWNNVNSQLGGSRGRSSSPTLIKCADDAIERARLEFGLPSG